MKRTKLDKGITLIALIITIIILLILAIVAIGSLKENNIITYAQKAQNDYTKAQEKEKISLALGEWQIEKHIPETTKTFEKVIESALKEFATVTENEDGTLTVIMKSENQYSVTESGKISEIKKDSQAEFITFV